MFGPWWGTLWTSVGAIIAALAAFWFARTIGRELIAERMADSYQSLDAEIRNSGSFYIFAIRLIPLVPYGIVSLIAGLTSINLRDYSIGTTCGTILGLFPFVWMGSSGITAIQTGDFLPLLGAFSLTALLIIGAAWYRRRRQFPILKDTVQNSSKTPSQPDERSSY